MKNVACQLPGFVEDDHLRLLSQALALREAIQDPLLKERPHDNQNCHLDVFVLKTHEEILNGNPCVAKDQLFKISRGGYIRKGHLSRIQMPGLLLGSHSIRRKSHKYPATYTYGNRKDQINCYYSYYSFTNPDCKFMPSFHRFNVF